MHMVERERPPGAVYNAPNGKHLEAFLAEKAEKIRNTSCVRFVAAKLRWPSGYLPRLSTRTCCKNCDNRSLITNVKQGKNRFWSLTQCHYRRCTVVHLRLSFESALRDF